MRDLKESLNGKKELNHLINVKSNRNQCMMHIKELIVFNNFRSILRNRKRKFKRKKKKRETIEFSLKGS